MRNIASFSTFFLLICCFSTASKAQDERFFRDIYTNKLKNANLRIDTRQRKVNVKSPLYQLDLNNDGLTESIVTYKKDNEDWFVIENFRGQKVFETRLFATGIDASIYKVNWSKISESSRVLIIHFYEGYTKSTKFEGIARLYFVTIDNNDLSTLTSTKGPYYWHEFEKPRETFWRRNFKVNVLDYDRDGKREVSVNYKTITSLYTYQGKGVWHKL